MALYAFDGTGDKWTSDVPINDTQKAKNGRYLSNVVLLYKHYLDAGLTGFYYAGVGSKRNPFDRALGGLLGFGAQGRARAAFRQAQKQFQANDREIDVIGYSRGAAIARIFADKIYREYYKLKDSSGRRLSEPPPIRFIGLFDTVASFGNPFNDNEVFFDDRIPANAENTFHAMALDFKRYGFGLDRAYGDNVLEVWFRGGHGDIGGTAKRHDGMPNRARTNITLRFMLLKAAACGAQLGQLPDFEVDEDAPLDIDSNNRETDNSRRIRNHDVFHYTVYDNNLPSPLIDAIGEPLASRDKAVIEERHNEVEVSEQRLLQLTRQLSASYPNTQAIYDTLYAAIERT